MKKILFLLVAAAFLFAACSDSSSSDVTLPSGGTLSGTWASECFAEGADSAKFSIVFDEGSGTYTFSTYLGDKKCAGETSSLSDEGTFTYVFGDVVDLKSGDSATQITTTDTAETLTSNDDDVTKALNADKLYGYDDWETGVAKDIFGLTDRGKTQTVEAQKDLVSVDETVTPAELSFGDEASATKDGFPTKLSSNPLTKQ